MCLFCFIKFFFVKKILYLKFCRAIRSKKHNFHNSLRTLVLSDKVRSTFSLEDKSYNDLLREMF